MSFTAPLLAWRTDSHGDIGYVVIEGETAERIGDAERLRRLETGQRRGFGSVKVQALIGDSRWTTSVFPQKGGTWFLPVRKAICRAEDLEPGDRLDIHLDLL
jgi:hypothetical protein